MDKFEWFEIEKQKRNLEVLFKTIRNEEREKLKNKNNIINESKKVGEKFISFLKYSILPKSRRKKFPFVVSNVRIPVFKGRSFKGGYRFINNQFISLANQKMCLNILRGYILLFFAIYAYFIKIKKAHKRKTKKSTNRNRFISSIYDLETFYYFFNKDFEEFYLSSNTFQDIQIAYINDLNQQLYLIDLYNIYCFYFLNLFFVLFNIEDWRYEHDKARTAKKRWKNIIKMPLKYFDLDFCHYTGSFFGSYCIFEYCIVDNNCTFHMYNSNYFRKYYIHRMKKINILEKYGKKKVKKDIKLLLKKSYYKYSLRPHHNIIKLKRFAITLPYVFFLLRTFYCLFLRQIRYNFYIRSHPVLDEHTSDKEEYIFANHGFAENPYQLDSWFFWKNWTMKKLKSSPNRFRKMFNFYSSFYYYRDYYIDHNTVVNDYTFSIINNNLEWNYFNKFKDNTTFAIVDEVSYEGASKMLYVTELQEGFKLMRRFKNAYNFILWDSDFEDFEEFVKFIYLFPESTTLLYNHLNLKLFYKFCLDMYINIFQKYFFFRDFFNYKKKKYFNISKKLTVFYLNIIYLIYYTIEPFFLRYFYREYWPLHNDLFFDFLLSLSHYLTYYVFENMERLTPSLLKSFKYYIWYVRWRFNASNYLDAPYHNYKYFFANHIFHMLTKNRIKNLLIRTNYFLNESVVPINYLYEYYKYSLCLKDWYFMLLNANVEYMLLFFFINKKKCINLYYKKNNFFYNDLMFYVGSNFIYRYYTLRILLTYDFYKHWWLTAWMFDLWIIFDIDAHEGPGFYRKRSERDAVF